MTEIIDDFEDGDITVAGASYSGWSGDTGSFSAQSSTVIAGSFSGELTASTTQALSVSATRGSGTTANAVALSVQISDDVGDPDDSVQVTFLDGGGSFIGRFTFTDNNGDLVFEGASNITIGSWSAGTTYDLAIYYDGTDVDVYVDGTAYGPVGDLDGSANGFQELEITNDASTSDASRSVFVDECIEEPQLGTPTLSLDDARATEVDASWTDEGIDEGYEVYSDVTSGVTTSDTLETTTAQDTTATTVTGLTDGQQRYFAVRTVAGGFAASPLSNEIQKQLDPPTITLDATRETEIDVGFTLPANGESVDVYYAESNGVTDGDTNAGNFTSDPATVTGLENGERYYLVAEAVDGDGIYRPSVESGEVNGTTTLPGATVTTTPDSTSAFTVTWTKEDNSSDGNWEVNIDGTQQTTVALGDTLEYQATGFAEGTLHTATIDRVTDHAETAVASDQHTNPLAPTIDSVTDISGDDITVGITDNSSETDEFRIFDSTDGGSTFTQNGGDIAAPASTLTASSLSRPDTHTLMARAVVGSGGDEAVSADSNTVDRYLAPSQSPTGGATWLIEIEHANGNVVRLQPNDASFTPRLNGLPTFEATVSYNKRWLSDSFDDATMRVWKDGRRLPIDTLVSRPTSPGETTLRGRGGSQLRRQADRIVDQNPVYDTGEQLVVDRTDYAANFDAPAGVVESDVLLQEADTSSELQNILQAAIADDTPLRLPPSAGIISAAQTNFFGLNDGGDSTPSGTFSSVSDGTLTDNNWEDADAMAVGPGDNLYFEYDVQHRIPASDLAVAIRHERGETVDMEVLVDGQTVFDNALAGSVSIDWFEFPENNGLYPTVEPADNPVRVELKNTDTSGTLTVDCLNLVDTRHHDISQFPNQIITDPNDPGYLYLPGPRVAPDTIAFTLADATPPVSIEAADVTASMPSGFAPKQIEVSGDQGVSYPLSVSDSETLDQSLSELVAQIRTRITLGADGTDQTETPVDGYATPEITDIEVRADLNETALFVNENFRGSVLDVLVDGADYADAAFEVQWDASTGEQVVEWTQPGQRTDTAERDIADFQLERTTENRFDRIRVVGRSVTVRDEALTADHGTAVQLDNEPIVPDSETVESSTEVFVGGRDYTLDYETGEITTLSSGAITDGESLVISYQWQPIGVADRSGASAPYTVRKVPLPALSTDREAEVAARRIRDDTSETLEEADVTLPPDAIGLTVIDELQFAALPTGATLTVREIADDPGDQTVRLGNRESIRDVIGDVRRKLSSTAENS